MWAWSRVLVGAGIIGVLLWQLGTRAFLDGLRVIDARTVFAALAIGLGTTLCCAARWCLVARRLGLRLSLRGAVEDYYRALFLNAVLPAGGLRAVPPAGGAGRGEGGGVRAVVLERFAGQVVVVGIAVRVLLARPAVIPERFHGAVVTSAAVVAAVTAAAAGVAVLAGKRWTHNGSPWRRASAASLGDLRRGLLARDAWPGVTLLSALAFAGHLAMFLLAARAAGASAPVAQLLPLMVLTLLAMGVPVNVGGWGPREGVAALAFAAAGLSAAQGLTAAVVYGVLALVAGLPGAFVLLLPVVARRVAALPAGRVAPRPAGRVAPLPASALAGRPDGSPS